MKVGDSRSIGGPGILPLQHVGIEADKWPLENRCSLLAFRIMGRQDNDGQTKTLQQLGHWVEDPEVRGDVIGGMHWNRSSRPIGAWRFSWPVRTSDGTISKSSSDEGEAENFGYDFTLGGKKIQFGVGAPSMTRSGIPDLFKLFNIKVGSGGIGIKVTPPPNKSNKPGTKVEKPQASVVTGDGFSDCKTMDDESMIPIWRGDWSGDYRFSRLSYKSPEEDGKRLWPKFPLDWFGIVMQADHENQQEELFYPTDPRMIAVHCHGDEEMGSLVGDMKSGFRVDGERIAPLQSVFKVGAPAKDLSGTISKFIPKHGDPRWKSFIALNVGTTGCEDNFGGLLWQRGAGNSKPKVKGPVEYTKVALPWMDNPRTSDYRNYDWLPSGAVAAYEKLSASGAFGRAGHGGGNMDFGAFKRKAIQDANSTVSIAAESEETVVSPPPSKDGCPVGRYAHVSQRYSGPFEFDCGNDHVLGEDLEGNKAYAAHISLNSYFVKPGGLYDGPLKHDGPWGGAGAAPFPVHVQFQFDRSMPHPFVKGARYGMHRWRSWTYYYEPFNPPTVPPGDPTKKVPDPDTTRKTVITDDGTEIPSGDAVPAGDRNSNLHGGGDVDPDLVREVDDIYGDAEPIQEFPLKYQYGVEESKVREYTPTDGFKAFVATTIESGMSAILARPQKIQGGWTDYRNWMKPDIDQIRQQIDKATPVTGRIESYGAQGPKNGSTYLSSSFDWDYTNRPETYRYAGGTASGGWCLTPPEVDMADIDNNLASVITGTSVSTTSFVAGPGTQFGTGLPDLENGGVSLGYTMRDSSGDLVFGTNASSVTTDQVVFDSSGNVGIGQTNPTYKLQVKDSGTSPVDANVFQIESAGDSSGDAWGMTFCNSIGLKGGIRGTQAASGTGNGGLIFSTSVASTLVPYTTMSEVGAWTWKNGIMDPVFEVDPESMFAGSSSGLLNLTVNTADTASGYGVIAMSDALIQPSTTPSGGGVLYVDGGALKFIGSSGTVTTIAVA